MKKKTRSKSRIICRELKGLIAKDESLNTIGKLAQKIGISENALTLKINGYRRWWFWEIQKITESFGEGDNFRKVFPELYDAIQKSA